MKLHENKTLFRQAVQFTADRLQIQAIFVEKDYWVTYALCTIFNDAIRTDTVFKGGTALSKCYKMIERFSEDIDLVVLRRKGESNNRLTTKIRTISEVVNAVLPEINIEGLTQKMGMNRKTAHAYNKEFQGDFGQVRDVIVVEATWLGYYEPNIVKSINSYVGEMMLKNGQVEMAREYGLLPFEIRVLEPERTICEKIMSMVRFSYGPNPMEDLRKKIRHTYDLHQLLKHPRIFDFFYSPAFDEMLLKVANDDVKSYKNKNQWLIYHPNESLIFKDLDSIWTDLRTAYVDDFKFLVYGILPGDEAVLNTLKVIKSRLAKVDWNIKLEL